VVAKQGTAVRNIRLDHENAEYIEGKVDGQTIVIITQYVKKYNFFNEKWRVKEY
jgi:protein PhnA